MGDTPPQKIEAGNPKRNLRVGFLVPLQDLLNQLVIVLHVCLSSHSKRMLRSLFFLLVIRYNVKN